MEHKMKLISYFSKLLVLICFAITTLPLNAETLTPSDSTDQVQHALVDQKVNINEANVEQLAKSLKGIGLTKAKAIVAYRESYGPFHSIQELASVKGIGKATLKKNEALLLLK